MRVWIVNIAIFSICLSIHPWVANGQNLIFLSAPISSEYFLPIEKKYDTSSTVKTLVVGNARKGEITAYLINRTSYPVIVPVAGNWITGIKANLSSKKVWVVENSTGYEAKDFCDDSSTYILPPFSYTMFRFDRLAKKGKRATMRIRVEHCGGVTELSNAFPAYFSTDAYERWKIRRDMSIRLGNSMQIRNSAESWVMKKDLVKNSEITVLLRNRNLRKTYGAPVVTDYALVLQYTDSATQRETFFFQSVQGNQLPKEARAKLGLMGHDDRIIIANVRIKTARGSFDHVGASIRVRGR